MNSITQKQYSAEIQRIVSEVLEDFHKTSAFIHDLAVSAVETHEWVKYHPNEVVSVSANPHAWRGKYSRQSLDALCADLEWYSSDCVRAMEAMLADISCEIYRQKAEAA